MLPLEVRAVITQPPASRLLKVASLEDMAAARHPVERMALDLRGLPVSLRSPALLDLPWGALLCDGAPPTPARSAITVLGDPCIVRPGDVIEPDMQRKRVAVRYRRGAKGNVLFATERCNSFCLMCSQPPRNVRDDWRVEHLCELAGLIDADEPSLAISGGEPTLLGAGLHRVVATCAQLLPNTHLHVLSNGRLLGESGLADLFRNAHPHLSWGIPLYGDHFALHDHVVQSEGAFAQTLRGLYALHVAGQCIEVRVVLLRPCVERLQQIARYITRNLPFVEHVALMGIEPVGFAKAHHQALWVDPADCAEPLVAAVQTLACAGMLVSLYNLPLCTLPTELWPHARQSISTWKNDYLEACTHCAVKPRCGGFFSSTGPVWTSRAVHPIKEELPCPAS